MILNFSFLWIQGDKFHFFSFSSKANFLIECLWIQLLLSVKLQLEFRTNRFLLLIIPTRFDLFRVRDHRNLLQYILSIKNKLSRPKVKYQVHFFFYISFLCLLSYLVLFVKTPLPEINEEIEHLIHRKTCSKNDIYCSSTKFRTQSWSILQMITNIWVFMFALEEFRQVRKK